MKGLRKKLALLLVFCMIFSMIPTAALAETSDGAANRVYVGRADTVIYNLGNYEVSVGLDEEESDYVFEEDGSFVIELEENAFFPYEVQFKAEEQVQELWFDTPESTVEFAGHTFGVHSLITAEATLTQLGFVVNGEYVAATPEPKEFTNDGGMSAYSLFPLEERFLSLRLYDFWPFELKAMEIAAVVDGVDSSKAFAWGLRDTESYQIVQPGATIDLSNFDGNSNSLEFIVGTAKQLDTENVRYTVNVYGRSDYPYDMFEASVDKVSGTERTPLEVYNTGFYKNDYYGDERNSEVYVDIEPGFTDADELYLTLNLVADAVKRGISVKAYAGEFATVEAAQASNTEITGQLFDKTEGYKINTEQDVIVTLVFCQNGVAMVAMPTNLDIYASHNHLYGSLRSENGFNSWGYNIAYDPEVSNPKEDYNAYVYVDQNTEENEFTLHLYKEYPANAIYGFSMSYYYKNKDDYENYGLSHISKAVIGDYYDSLDAAESQTDIKDQLFSYSGYKANYSGEGQKFTVFTNEGEIFQFMVKAVDGERFNISSGLLVDKVLSEDKAYEFARSSTSGDFASDDDVPVYTYRMEYRDSGTYEWVLLPADAKCYVKLNYHYHALNVEASASHITKAVIGHYETLEAAAGQQDIKDAIFGDGYLACYNTAVEFTVFDDEGSALHIKVKTTGRAVGEFVRPMDIFDEDSTEYTSVAYGSYKLQTNNDTGLVTATYPLYKGVSLNKQYNVSLRFYYNGSSDDSTSHVEKAVVGHYTSLEAAKDQSDIKDALFDINVGHKAVYKDGVEFTIFDDKNQVHNIIVKVEASNVERPGLDYTDLNVRGVQGVPSYEIYKVTTKDDSMSSFGYQTLFIDVDEDDYYYNNVDLAALKPTFTLRSDRSNVYAPDAEGKLVMQKSGESVVDFTNSPVQYTVAAANGANNQNYWITFVQKAVGPKLFVIRTAEKEKGTTNDLRELFIDSITHDVLVANVGDETLTGIKAELTEAINVKVDDYWTIGGNGNDTLGAFELQSYNYEEQWNLGKVRLLPLGFGKVSGYLTISAPGQETVKIKLTGDVTAPKFTRTEIPQAVKYVPYATLIQSDNKYSWNEVTFEVVGGNLPVGIELKPNGELYGVPKETGEFKFMVAIVSSNELFTDNSVKQEFTLTVLNNTDENVASKTDTEDGYGIKERVEDRYVSEITAQDFVSEGEYAQFVDFWLDGDKLEEGVDYDSEKGSTKITIRSETFKKYSTAGIHTIAAEFRKPVAAGETDTNLRKTAQNYEIKVQSSSGNSSHRPSGSSGSGGGKPAQPAKPVEPEKPVEPQQPAQPQQPQMNFSDVPSDAWFYEYILWAYKADLMQGNGDGTFGPNEPTSPAALVTVLARLAGVDLTSYAAYVYDDVAEGMWYTNSAKWAKANGLLGEKTFEPDAAIARSDIAQILLAYLQMLGVEMPVVENPQQFADLDQMSAEENNAFQILYVLGIFQGNGDNTMNPQGATTRAELAALLQRVSNALGVDNDTLAE